MIPSFKPLDPAGFFACIWRMLCLWFATGTAKPPRVKSPDRVGGVRTLSRGCSVSTLVGHLRLAEAPTAGSVPDLIKNSGLSSMRTGYVTRLVVLGVPVIIIIGSSGANRVIHPKLADFFGG